MSTATKVRYRGAKVIAPGQRQILGISLLPELDMESILMYLLATTFCATTQYMVGLILID